MRAITLGARKTGGTGGTVGQTSKDAGFRVPPVGNGRWDGETAAGDCGGFVPPVPPELSGGPDVVQLMLTRVVPPVPPVPPANQGLPLAERSEEEPGPLAEVPPPFRDHTPHAEDFSRWALAHCVFRDGCYQSIAALLGQFCDWRIALKGEGGPWLATFAALLESEGFALGNALTAGMVYGLVPKAEYLSLTTPGHMAKEAAWNGKGR